MAGIAQQWSFSRCGCLPALKHIPLPLVPEARAKAHSPAQHDEATGASSNVYHDNPAPFARHELAARDPTVRVRKTDKSTPSLPRRGRPLTASITTGGDTISVESLDAGAACLRLRDNVCSARERWFVLKRPRCDINQGCDTKVTVTSSEELHTQAERAKEQKRAENLTEKAASSGGAEKDPEPEGGA